MKASSPLIIIGGHGFIGSCFAARAIAAGREVHRVGRRVAENAGVRDWHWGEGEALVRAVAGRAPVIVDLAYSTVPSTSFGDPVGDFTANLGAVIHHLQFATSVEAAAFLYVSSGGTVYGDAVCLPLTEDSPTRPISPYGITKLAGEHYTLMHHRLGLPVMIARPSNIYGPGQIARAGQGLVAAAFAAARSRSMITVFGDGSQRRDYLYIDDFCSALDALLEHGENGATYNVGSGVGVSTTQLMALIDAIVAKEGHRLRITHANARPFDVNANILDSSRIAAATHWRASTELIEGLERSWNWTLGR